LQLGDRSAGNAAFLWMPWAMNGMGWFNEPMSNNDIQWLMGTGSGDYVTQLAYLEASRVRMGGCPAGEKVKLHYFSAALCNPPTEEELMGLRQMAEKETQS
jgi:hypothetical protein